MSAITLSPNASGTGTLTIAAPNTNTNRTLTLPDVTGTVVSTGDSGSVSQAMVATGVAGTGPAFSAYQSSAQTFSNATYTKIQFQTEEFDTANCFDSTTNYRFTPNVAGYYQISGGIYVGTTTGLGLLVIYKNGSEAKRISGSPSPISSYANYGSALVYLNGSSDYVELYLYQSSGGNATVPFAQKDLIYFQAFLARAA